MTRHVLLDNVTHRDLKVDPTFAPGHGYDTQTARVFPDELGTLQNEYPLFFVKNPDSGHFEPIALLGFEDGENLYLGRHGWQARVRPLSVERGPLLIGFQEQDRDGVPTQVPVVHIDLDHPSVGKDDGEALFLPHGGESEWLERMTGVLMAIHEGHERLAPFSQTLVGLELIESIGMDIRFGDDSKKSLKGLYTINEERLAALGGSALETLHKKGYLKAIYMMLASLPNMTALIDFKNQRLAAADAQ